MIRTFRVSVSDRYPVKSEKWKDLGIFEARNSREIQAFLINGDCPSPGAGNIVDNAAIIKFVVKMSGLTQPQAGFMGFGWIIGMVCADNEYFIEGIHSKRPQLVVTR